MRINRIINVRYTVDGLRFDAAIDPDWQLHAYREMSVTEKKKEIPIEIYCFDYPEWDILMLYQTKEDANCTDVNTQQDEALNDFRQFDSITLHSCCNFDKIIEATREWIEENRENEARD